MEDPFTTRPFGCVMRKISITFEETLFLKLCHSVLYVAMQLILLERSSFRSRLLDETGRQRRNRNIPRIALVDPENSPWTKLYESGSDPALITVCGFDHDAFGRMLRKFTPLFLAYTPWTGKSDGRKLRRLKKPAEGRTRIITAHACLGLVLLSLLTRLPEWTSQGCRCRQSIFFGFVSLKIRVIRVSKVHDFFSSFIKP